MSHHAFFDFAWTLGRRSGVLQRLIGSFKFQYQRSASTTIIELMHRGAPSFPLNAVMVPIPTAATHVRQRGYDHSLILAKKLGKRRNLAIRRMLVRCHDAVQHKSTRAQRLQQAQTAFRVVGAIDASLTYVVFDDIVTTGATLNQAARVLKEAGARTVWVIAIAHQALD